MEHIPGYDEWKTTPPEQGPATYCDCCGCEVYEGAGRLDVYIVWVVMEEFLVC